MNGASHETRTPIAWRVADRAALAVTGKDRTRWLNGLVTQDVSKVVPGRAAYGLLVEKKGRIQTDFYAVADDEALVLFVPTALRDATMATLDHYLVMEDAELAARELPSYLVLGRRAAELAGERPLSGALDLFGPAAFVAGVSEDEMAAAAIRAGGSLVDEAAFEAARIERGLPRFGVEVDATLYPQEASLADIAVAWDKGCYLGQEVVYMLQNRGHAKRKLVPLEVEGGAAPGDAVTSAVGDDAVGEVKSASGARAIAMVKWSSSEPGTALRAAGRPAVVRAFDPA